MLTDEQVWALTKQVSKVHQYSWNTISEKYNLAKLSWTFCSENHVALDPLSNTSHHHPLETSCLLVCLLAYAENHHCLILLIQLCFNIRNNVKHAHLIYYLGIFHSNKKHSWFYLIWSQHHISIIFSLKINHGFVVEAFHPLLLLKASNSLLVRIDRL